jgi:hypothetical protein
VFVEYPAGTIDVGSKFKFNKKSRIPYPTVTLFIVFLVVGVGAAVL